jgi:hypothetical protein
VTTKTLSARALTVIDSFLHFKAGSAVCSIPYFNNKVTRTRIGLRTNIGKGSPEEIFEELKSVVVKNHIALDSLADESLKKLLVDNNIGIDCSGFAYHVLNAQSIELGKGSLRKHIAFKNSGGFFGKLRASLRPVENCDVATLADDANSRSISLNDVRPGDIITMLGGPDQNDRDHILVIDQVEYHDSTPRTIHYSHAVAYPEDGVYGTGVKQGSIEIVNSAGTLLGQKWVENGAEGDANRIFSRSQKSTTELRRLI